MQLRPYQNKAHDSVFAEWDNGIDRTLLVMATGGGKTIVFSKISETAVKRGWRVLILAHRGELLDQAADKMEAATGLGCSREQAELSSIGDWFRITVGSIQTLMRDKRLESFDPDHFDVIIVDEAHHALSDSYLKVLNYFGSAKVLGVTATPDRGDMRNLGEFFQSLAFEYTMPEAIRDGYLVPIKAQTIPLKIEMPKSNGKEYSADMVGNALDPYLDNIAREMSIRCKDRKTVVFTPLIATSRKLHTILERYGMSVVEVNGDTENRDQLLSQFDKQEGGVILNSMLLTEGWDCTSVDCVIVLRATKMRSLYVQMVGRGTRLHPGKEFLLLLDFLWHSDRLDLCRPANLVCESDEVAQAMTERINESAAPIELDERAIDQAETDTVEAREEALAKTLAEMAHRKQRLVDPLQYAMSIGSEDLSGYKPAFGWEMEKPNEKQVNELAKIGILPTEIESAGKAQKIIDKVSERRDAGLASPKQIRTLERYGFKHVGKWPTNSAKKLVNRIAASRWVLPKGINPESYNP